MKKYLLTTLALGIGTALLAAPQQTPNPSQTPAPATTKGKTGSKKKPRRKKGQEKTSDTHENHKN